MIADKDKGVTEFEGTDTRGKGDLRCFVNDTVIKSSPCEYRAIEQGI